MKIVAKNKKALFNYEVIKEYEAGMVLQGWEVKSIKASQVSIKESFVTVQNGEAFLQSAHVSPFKNSDKSVKMDEYRARKLLLHKNEIIKIEHGKKISGGTVIPLKIYFVRGKAKLTIALAKGKKQYDKRASLKEKDFKKQINRDLINAR